MSLLYDPEKRYRRRRARAFLRILFYAAVLFTVAIFAYQIGVEETKGRAAILRDQLNQLEAESAADRSAAVRAEAEVARAESAQQLAEQALEDLRAQIPTGDLQRLTTLIESKLADGIPPERLTFRIESASLARECTGTEAKRFILSTPAYSGPNTSVTFAEGRITVAGDGENALSVNDGVLGWFDPEKDVTISFTLIGGEQSIVAGILPLHHSVLLGNEEFRFTVVADEQSLVRVTTDRCALPEPEEPPVE